MRYAALGIALLIAVPAAASPGGSWEDREPLALARQEVGAARIGNSVYVVGGLLAFPPLIATPTVEIYDIARNRWAPGPALPLGLDHMAVAALDGHVYVMGGFAGDFASRDEVWVLAPGATQWTPGPPLPAPRGAPWAVAHGGRIYLFGGSDAADVAQTSTFIFDPATGWSSGAPMTVAREHLNAVSLGDFIYVIGGRSHPPGQGLTPTGANERYDPLADEWKTLAPMPTPRSAMAMAAFDGRIFAMGGEIPQLFAVNEFYDPVADEWDGAEPMPIPRHGVAAVTLDDRILVPAGGIVQGLLPTSAVDSFIPPPRPVPALGRVGRWLLIAAIVVALIAVGRRLMRSRQ